jgi:molecular chaperone DnaK
LKDLGDKIDGAKKADVEKEIERVREALKGTDIEAIKSSYETLQTKFQEISAELYKNAAASAGSADASGAGAAPEPEAKKDADVVDAEFEMVDEDKDKKK